MKRSLFRHLVHGSFLCIMSLQCMGASINEQSFSICQRLSLTPKDKMLLSDLKRVSAELSDRHEQALHFTAYYYGCLLAQTPIEADRCRRFLMAKYKGDISLRFLSAEWRTENCPRCGGTGNTTAVCGKCDGSGQCPECRGKGRVLRPSFDGASSMAPCLHCGGRGRCKTCNGVGKWKRACSLCNGKGGQESAEKIEEMYKQLLYVCMGKIRLEDIGKEGYTGNTDAERDHLVATPKENIGKEAHTGNTDAEGDHRDATSKLVSEYLDNPIRADRDYKGKTLSITGRPGKIDTDISGEPYILIETSHTALDIMCQFPKHRLDSIAEITTSDNLEISGVCKGKTFGKLLLEDCRIEKTFRKPD